MMDEQHYTEKWSKRTGTSAIWQTVAPIYDRWVTLTKNRMLRLYINKEQELLDNYLAWILARNPEKRISILEIGSGTGRTLLCYAHKPTLIERMEYLIGIDNAPAMYDIAKYKLSQEASVLNHVENGSHIISKYVFLKMEAKKLSRYFYRGRVDARRLELEIEEEPVGILDEEKYNRSIKVVINMLNTLGVIKQSKSTVLRNMVMAAGPEGRIVVSVFNGKAFRDHAEDIYTSIRNIVGKFDKDDFDYSSNEFASQSYYSHWFTRTEIEGMMERAGCSNIRTKEIDNIGLFVTSEISK